MNSTDSRPLMVTIRCITYNHEPYIRQCLEGFVMQKTNFRFETIVHDDASTDGTTDIIREYAERYPDIIKPIYEVENQYSKQDGSLRRIMDEACKGKYIALCEGDDYWIDPYKLQKQVDILEKDKNISLVYTAFYNVDKNGYNFSRPAYEKYMERSYSGNNLPELLKSNFILTCTTMLRRDIYITDVYKKVCFLDYGLFLTAAAYGDFHYIKEKTSCYRFNPTSLIATKNPDVGKKYFMSLLNFIKVFISGLPKKQSKEEELACANNILNVVKQHGFIFLEKDILRKYKVFRKNNYKHYLYILLKCYIYTIINSKKKYNLGAN